MFTLKLAIKQNPIDTVKTSYHFLTVALRR